MNDNITLATSLEGSKTGTVILAAGGTGGHVFPALALAEVLQQRGYRPLCVVDPRTEKYVAHAGFDFHVVTAGRLSGSLWQKAQGVWSLGKGYMQAARLCAKEKPLAAVGFGGYPSFPTMMAAVRASVPTLIHEQNSVLGQANYVLAPRVHAIATSFQEVRGIKTKDHGKVCVTGNPVRPDIQTIRAMEYPAPITEGMLRILVVGGSLGARIFSTLIPETLLSLPKEFRQRVRVDQQCRAEDVEAVRALYHEAGIQVDLAPFFSDVPARLAAAHLVICRAGASTVAELAVAGRPSILIPYAEAKEDHQTLNAEALEDAGGAWVFPESVVSPAVLMERLCQFMTAPELLVQAAHKARSVGVPAADQALADLVEATIDASSDGHSQGHSGAKSCCDAHALKKVA